MILSREKNLEENCVDYDRSVKGKLLTAITTVLVLVYRN